MEKIIHVNFSFKNNDEIKDNDKNENGLLFIGVYGIIDETRTRVA